MFEVKIDTVRGIITYGEYETFEEANAVAEYLVKIGKDAWVDV